MHMFLEWILFHYTCRIMSLEQGVIKGNARWSNQGCLFWECSFPMVLININHMDGKKYFHVFAMIDKKKWQETHQTFQKWNTHNNKHFNFQDASSFTPFT